MAAKIAACSASGSGSICRFAAFRAVSSNFAAASSLGKCCASVASKPPGSSFAAMAMAAAAALPTGLAVDAAMPALGCGDSIEIRLF
jgi:hypothetical protein